MKILDRAYRIGRSLVPLLCAAGLTACGSDDTRTLEEELDAAIRNRGIYEREKEARIDELRGMLRVTGLSPRQEYAINARLYQEFWKYKLDSAIRYAERNLAIARELDDRGAGIATSLHLAQLYSFSGKSLETKEILDTELYFIDAIGLAANLSPTRANGLVAMIKQMRLYALAFEAKEKEQKHE